MRILVAEFHNQPLVMATRTASRIMLLCHDWAFKGCKVQPGFQFSPALRDGIWMKRLCITAYIACLPLLYQEYKWLSGKSIWLVFRRSWVQITAGSQIFFSWINISLSQKKHQPTVVKMRTSDTTLPTPTHTTISPPRRYLVPCVSSSLRVRTTSQVAPSLWMVGGSITSQTGLYQVSSLVYATYQTSLTRQYIVQWIPL